MTVRRANRLAGEKSPYLLQHAHNPVDWHPWGDAAFALARSSDRPIFLSVGYATCHWCHVMEKESFEDERVAALLNEGFDPVKVDREERPDVDRLYMTAMQALGLGGGWPLTVFLTPDLAPFYGGTYFPPEGRGGQVGLLDLLPRVSEAWRNERAALEENGVRLFEAIERLEVADGAQPEAAGLCDAAWWQLERTADPEWGGFGRAPKFPTAANLAFLWRDAERVERVDPARAETARKLALLQLARMREGGIHDHLGGGFHRYSVDRRWLVPHFEKMLYDQAQLLDAYVEAYRATGLPEWKETARGIAAYVARDLTGPHGGFLSAEDADSEGEEGRFYVWRPSELEDVLGAEEGARVAAHFGVTAEGNFEHGASVLHLAHPSSRENIPTAQLLAARAKRPRPLLDDKIITAWNGLMIAALARASWILEDEVLADHARRAATFAWERLWSNGTLARRWRDGEAAGEGQLDDFAFLAHGFLALHQATFEPEWLERAIALTDSMIRRFADAEGGGFFESPEGDPTIRVRMKDAFDGAELAGNSIAARVLLALAALTDRADFARHAQATLDAFAVRIAEHPSAMPMMLVAMMDALAPPRHVAIVCEREGDDARALVRAARVAASPRDLVLRVDPGSRERLAAVAPFVAPLTAKDGVATAYVCVGHTCHAPTTDPDRLARELRA